MRNTKTKAAVFFTCIIGMTALFITEAQASRIGTSSADDMPHKKTGICKTLPVSYNQLGQKTYGRMVAIGYDFTRDECAKDSTAKFENVWTEGD